MLVFGGVGVLACRVNKGFYSLSPAGSDLPGTCPPAPFLIFCLSKMRSFLFGVPLGALLGTALAQSTPCYYANGTALKGRYEFVPCSNSVKTICCALNRQNSPGGDIANGQSQDVCLSNGLCENRWVNAGTTLINYWLNFCTNKDVTSSDCLDICRDSRDDTGAAQLTPCDGTRNSTRWCCGNSLSCCKSNDGYVELPQEFHGAISTSKPSPASPSASSSASSAPKSSASSTGFQVAQSQGKELSAGAKAGIAVGIVAAVLVALAAGYFARQAQRYKKEASTLKATNELFLAEKPIYDTYAHEAPVEPSELPSGAHTWELNGNTTAAAGPPTATPIQSRAGAQPGQHTSTR